MRLAWRGAAGSVFSGVVLACSMAFFAQSPGGRPETAREILASMAQVYASCTSYQDTGTVETTYTEGTACRTEEIRFSTAFVRPGRFRFEYVEERSGSHHHRYIIWKDREEVRSWWDVRPGVETPKSLDDALSAATGVSAGSSHRVPVLLLPGETSGKRLTDLLDPQRGADAAVLGEDCTVITGSFMAKDMKVPVTLWISKASHLLLKVEEKFSFPHFESTQVTTYHPKLNGEVPKECLAFDPPKAE